MTTEAITSAALALPPESRATLVDILLQSLDPKSTIHFHDEWVAEIDDRIAAYERGELKTYSREEVLGQLGESAANDT